MSELHTAAKNGDLKLVQSLIEEGADVNSTNVYGTTPLILASWEGHVEIVKLLLEKGANVNSADNVRSTPIHKASEKGHIEVAKLLIKEGADINQATNHRFCFTPIHMASGKGHVEVVNLLVEKGADVNQDSKFGFTPLFEASLDNHIDVVRFLIEKGADVNHVISANGHSALYVAAMKGHRKVAKLLIEAILYKNPKVSKHYFFIDEGNYPDIPLYWDKYKVKLSYEIECLKQVTFGETTLFDLCFTQDENKLATIACSKEIQNRIAKPEFTKNYPIYGEKIKLNFEKGLRNKALNTSLNSVYYNNKNDKLLPPECWLKILKNLNIQDLKNVTQVASLFFKPALSISNTSEMVEIHNPLSNI